MCCMTSLLSGIDWLCSNVPVTLEGNGKGAITLLAYASIWGIPTLFGYLVREEAHSMCEYIGLSISNDCRKPAQDHIVLFPLVLPCTTVNSIAYLKLPWRPARARNLHL